jgi:aconitate hydratase 2/2-methylisocitrate dehydratase
MLEAYLKHVEERKKLGIPPLPLSKEEAAEVCEALRQGAKEQEDFLVRLLEQRVSPGVDDGAKVKADFLWEILKGKVVVGAIPKKRAIDILKTMIGGYCVPVLLWALRQKGLAQWASDALSELTLVYDGFDEVQNLAKENEDARKVLEAWAEAKWFLERPPLPATVKVKIFRVDGEINTDDLSPASDASTRADIPLHALSMGRKRFPGGIEKIAQWRAQGHRVAFVGDVVGTGSSRKSATNSLMWHIGEDIPFVPNKRRSGIVIGGVIAPIFFNTVEDSGGLPIVADVKTLVDGMEVGIDFQKGEIRDEKGNALTTFTLKPKTLPDEYRAGGRTYLIIGRSLTEKARSAIGLGESDVFVKVEMPKPKEGQGYSLGQKIVGRACGMEGVLPGSACEPKMTTVASQDTTGPMTAEELKELACLRFQAPLFMQSFCHTAAYPKKTDVNMHKSLRQFVVERGGISLRPGDGVIHSWVNRMILPDTVGTGGDSHTRFPLGISFPAGSGLVAFAGAMGFMPLDMPESVLVRFKGRLRAGITLRDVVNAVPLWAIRKGLLTVPKKGKINVFNGRIIEFEGLEDLHVEQAFELCDASAERSALAAVISLSEETVARFVKSNVALLKSLLDAGYQATDAIGRRIEAMEKWLEKPTLLRRDENAEFTAVIEVALDEITEPIVACPNDPDDVRFLSEVAGQKIDDVFIGSCMTNIGHYRAAAAIFQAEKFNPNVRIWLAPPTRMDQQALKEEGLFAIFAQVGARIEIPGCSLCMGNQARVPDGSWVFSTSTRNFDHRMGTDAKVFLGSAELAAVTAVLGRIPTVDEYMHYINERVEPKKDQIYKYLYFHEMGS